MGHFPCAVTPWFTYKVRLVWNPPLLLLCYKEDAMLTPVSPGCCNIFSSYNQVRRYLLPGIFPPSSQPYGLRTPATAGTVPNFCGPWPSWWEHMSGKSAQNAVFWFTRKHPFFLSARNLKWSCIWFHVPKGTWCGVWLSYSTSGAVSPTTVEKGVKHFQGWIHAFHVLKFWSLSLLEAELLVSQDLSQVPKSHSWVLPQVLSLELVFLITELEHYLSFGPSKI